jgi:hypothetical protein
MLDKQSVKLGPPFSRLKVGINGRVMKLKFPNKLFFKEDSASCISNNCLVQAKVQTERWVQTKRRQAKCAHKAWYFMCIWNMNANLYLYVLMQNLKPTVPKLLMMLLQCTMSHMTTIVWCIITKLPTQRMERILL